MLFRLFQARGPRAKIGKATFSLFLVGFALVVALRSFGAIPGDVIDPANDVSRWCLVAAIAAFGMKTSFKEVFETGWRPVCLMGAETGWIAPSTRSGDARAGPIHSRTSTGTSDSYA